MGSAFAAALLLAISMIIVFFAVNKLTRPDEQLLTRLENITQPEKEGGKRPKLSQRLSGSLGKAAQRSGRDSKMATQLARANMTLTVGEFMLVRLAIMLAAFAAGWLFSGMVLGGLGLALLANFLPGWYLKRQHKKRQQLFQEQLPDVLMLVVSSLKAGHGLVQAMNLVTQEMPAPSNEEFGRVVKEIALGLPNRDALTHLVERIESDDLDLVVTAINIQHEVGGNLAAILSTISETIRERVRIQGEIRVMTTSQRATGFILTGMPFVLGGILFVMNRSYMMGLFHPDYLCLPIGAFIMIILGNVVMRKMLSFDF